MFRTVLPLLFFVLAATPPLIGRAAGPEFVSIVQTIESQPVPNAKLVYWDQALADLLGIKVPAGRPGQEHFENAVKQLLAFEVKEATTGVTDPAGNFGKDGRPYIFVENDPFGGSGRAGYIQVGSSNTWVNTKGLGQTGAGRTSTIAPPKNTFSSHQDGSATLEEAIKETIMARVADAEMKTGSSRVLAILYTGRMMEYPDGRKVPLALIVRAPLRRFDQGNVHKTLVADALGHANASRIMKGDFVNDANMGAFGEFVDFGCMTHTCGYAPLKSSQNQTLLSEGRYYINASLMDRKLAENLFLQLGIPEAHLEKLNLSTKANAKRFEEIGLALRNLVYSENEITILDFNQVPREKLVGRFHLHEIFRDLAGDYFDKRPARKKFVAQQLARFQKFYPGLEKDEKVKKLCEDFLEKMHAIFTDIRIKNKITKFYPGYAAKVRTIAHFKNREIDGIVRPNLFSSAGSVADGFSRDLNAEAVQQFIENTVYESRFGTTPAADSGLIAHAHAGRTELFIRAHTDSKGVTRLFTHPELTGAATNETFAFRVSTDGWKTSRDIPAQEVTTRMGEYFKVILPNADFPLTHERVELTPFVKTVTGEPRWLSSGFNIRGPPIVFNERLGLPESFERQPGIMRSRYHLPINFIAEDIDSAREAYNPLYFNKLFRRMGDPMPEVVQDALTDFQYRKEEFLTLYKKHNDFRIRVNTLMTDGTPDVPPLLKTELRAIFMSKKSMCGALNHLFRQYAN